MPYFRNAYARVYLWGHCCLSIPELCVPVKMSDVTQVVVNCINWTDVYPPVKSTNVQGQGVKGQRHSVT